MPNPFAKGWNYLKASLDKTVEDNADPKILVHQAMQGAREQHKAVADQAAAVIGNARQLEIQMGTQSRRIEELQGQVRQTLQVADQTRKGGDEAKASQLEAQAEQLAAGLVSQEQELEHTRQLHGQAVQAAEQAKQAVTQSEQRLRETLAQEDRLVLQATQAQMKQQEVDALTGVSSSNSPTFAEIQAKIEGRYTTALGRQELAEATGRTSTAQLDAAATMRESEGKAKLDQIRASMGLSAPATPPAGQLSEQAASTAARDTSDQETSAAAGPTPATAQESDPATASSSPTLPRDTRDDA